MQFSHTVLASTDSNAFASVRERTTTRDERFALGRSLREKVPISALGVWNATQARTDPILETGHQFGESGGRQAHLARGSREPAGIDRANKGGHFCRTIHTADYGPKFTNVLPKSWIVRCTEGN